MILSAVPQLRSGVVSPPQSGAVPQLRSGVVSPPEKIPIWSTYTDLANFPKLVEATTFLTN